MKLLQSHRHDPWFTNTSLLTYKATYKFEVSRSSSSFEEIPVCSIVCQKW